ncbi:alanine/glycine:cation symporter family protein [Staphylococcus pseudintermedius]|uniref:alanine/glycine:cation symporter family protein n=1 Tax=Staphylococcus pseudintermedius TaxID=283734 RepID=UPI000BBC6B9D|nr:sodium:alanine symporter family protein [Staphylococcus pseudintermedius]EGQ4257537.1 sodium:alanine symporter family protein [Staphylococcus pseudintermedius]EHS7222795.1 sodium:alanine symporter family protein [Staphylococcus pseudintermedius]EII2009284.1 sodium:alanine symporter family protein [Staphylococcus pseudintermedius]EJD5683241.1 sodium:alanine symporter family protein [Staphylococcus pseudintermedius]EJL1417291.1 sodium:alanine symporter family protein [Staphylococcus pseudinte
MINILEKLNAILWGAPSLILLTGTGLFLTFVLKGMQFTKLIHAFKLAFVPNKKEAESEGDISNFKALMTSLAGMIGNGNIAGVATAVTLGGPGAIFWMWVVGLLGMTTKYAEALLAMKFRVQNDKGEYSSGPMYYIEKGLGHRFKFLAIAFAIFGAFAALGIGNSVQSNTIADVMTNSFNVSGFITGIVLVILISLIIFGGLKRISNVAGFFVPMMAIFYIGASVTILIINYDQILPAFGLIFKYAFTPVSAAGGFTGIIVMQAIQNGVSKGIFSNEAGLGTVALISGNAKAGHPATQALVAMTGTFIVTIIVCTMTGLVLLVTGYWDPTGGLLSGVSHDAKLEAGALTSMAFGASLGTLGEYVVSLSVIFFGFSTIIAWFVYGAKCFEYLFGVKYVMLYGVIYVIATFVGTIANLKTVWLFADTANAMMMIPNLIGILFLYKIIKQETESYFKPNTQNYSKTS